MCSEAHKIYITKYRLDCGEFYRYLQEDTQGLVLYHIIQVFYLLLEYLFGFDKTTKRLIVSEEQKQKILLHFHKPSLFAEMIKIEGTVSGELQSLCAMKENNID